MADVRFGVFQLDVSSGELFKAGVRVALAAQPLQILIALLDRPGAVITRDELRQRLWPSDTFVDFEHGLNAAVKRLRDALGEDAASPRFIETFPGGATASSRLSARRRRRSRRPFSRNRRR